MKKKSLIALILITIISACNGGATSALTQTADVTATLPGPSMRLTQVPDVQAAADAFLGAWQSEEYDKMYEQLTSLSQDAITLEDFSARYAKVAITMTLQDLEYQILSTLTEPTSAEVSYRVTFKTTLLGEITRDMMKMKLSLVNSDWQVQWEEGMILPELRGGNVLELKYKIPARGNIYDKDGHALVAQDDAVAFGVVPGWIDPDQEGYMLRVLADLSNLQSDDIRQMYEYAQPDWYIPVGEISAEVAAQNQATLSGLSGVLMTPFRSRYYYEGGIAPHVVGYVLSISPEKLEQYQRNGYRGDEKIGADGLEQWGEEYLAGKHGAKLYVKDPEGQIVTLLASTESEPAYSIYSTIEKDYQLKLQQSMGEFNGAIVVVEIETGRVLAMVSNPTYDPNLFEPTNKNNILLGEMLTDPELPLYNRAAQGVYPLGSVFKIITMATALETGVFNESSSYYCGSAFTELAGETLYDWTYEKGLPPSGDLTLPEGLMRSCNPWFWHIGLELWNQGYTTSLTDMAFAFGLGKQTGIEIFDQAGNLVYPESDRENVQLAIGQGTMQVTPLQVAMFIAAIGNGGTLYRPGVVETIAPLDDNSIYEFEPEVVSQLPVTEENLRIIQEAMRSVITNGHGTAHYELATLPVRVAGKTGTAENPNGDSHAWFAGYTLNNNPDRPDIAVVVILENAGEGSKMAAPLFRRAVSLYFSYNVDPAWTLPWEASPYIIASPTPIPSETPVE